MLLFAFFLATFCSMQSVCYQHIEQKRLAKLIWQLPCHIVCTFVGLYFADKTSSDEMIYSGSFAHADVVYEFYYAYWTSVILEFVQSEKDVDCKMMALHHIATVIAIVSSDVLGYHRIGLHVLLLHDLSDVWIMILKLCFKLKVSENIQIVVYILCMFFWFYTRIYMFVYCLCYEVLFKFVQIALVPIAMLYLLAVCNLVWTYMLLRLPFVNNVVSNYEG